MIVSRLYKRLHMYNAYIIGLLNKVGHTKVF